MVTYRVDKSQRERQQPSEVKMHQESCEKSEPINSREKRHNLQHGGEVKEGEGKKKRTLKRFKSHSRPSRKKTRAAL